MNPTAAANPSPSLDRAYAASNPLIFIKDALSGNADGRPGQIREQPTCVT